MIQIRSYGFCIATLLLVGASFGLKGLLLRAEGQVPSEDTKGPSPPAPIRVATVGEPQAGTPAGERLTVDFRDGQLAIDAQNSTLADVLKLVATKTGTSIRIPPGSGLERIFEHGGPGPVRNVLEHLLNGSSFNFVIINSPQRSVPREILLTLTRAASVQVDLPAPEAPKQSLLWTPPDTTDRPIPLSAEVDDTLAAPKEPMSPQAMSEFMRQKQRELREKALERYPERYPQ